jgi:hypothetical protein
MARTSKGDRSQAEERFDRARKTNEEAKSIIDLERDAMRKKTEQLRKLRLAQEAKAGITPIDKPPSASKKPKAAPKKRK